MPPSPLDFAIAVTAWEESINREYSTEERLAFIRWHLPTVYRKDREAAEMVARIIDELAFNFVQGAKATRGASNTKKNNKFFLPRLKIMVKWPVRNRLGRVSFKQIAAAIYGLLVGRS